MFSYCGNNPVNRAEFEGNYWDTVFDVASLVLSIGDVASDPTDVGAWAGLVCDVVDVVIPFVSGLGETARAVNAALDVADAMDDIHDATKVADAIDDATDTYKAVSGGLCFVAGTEVLCEDGTTTIESIQPGDLVWAWDEEADTVELKEVVETYVSETTELIHVFVGAEEIVATPAHPFYSPVKGWTEAAQLRAGDILVLVNGEYVIVEKVQHEILDAPVTVYNFHVADFHTYYVSGAGVLVHNSCAQPSDSFTKLANNSEAKKVAKQLGYSQTNELSYGQLVFKNAKAKSDLRYITRDIDSHNGGVWKAASSVKALGSKNTRSGTYSRYLLYLGE